VKSAEYADPLRHMRPFFQKVTDSQATAVTPCCILASLGRMIPLPASLDGLVWSEGTPSDDPNRPDPVL